MSAGGVPPWPPPGAPLEELIRFQSIACGALGSPLYAELLRRAAADFEVGGPTRELLGGHQDDPPGSALVLRLMGAVNRLVLAGRAPALAAAYAAEKADYERSWLAFREVLAEHAGELAQLIERPVQTNEVGRCAALLPGFLAAAAAGEMPLALLEVGASAGLNLRWDRYRYEAPGFSWGPADSVVRIEFETRGDWPAAKALRIAERRGCDPEPVEIASREGRETILAYIWPDQKLRVARTRAAIELAARIPAQIVRAGAAEWVARELAEPRPGRATILFHSIVMQYLSAAEREAFAEAVGEAGERASAAAPLAWLRMEPAPGGGRTEVWIRRWPGAEERLLAAAGYHGTPVDVSVAGR